MPKTPRRPAPQLGAVSAPTATAPSADVAPSADGARAEAEREWGDAIRRGLRKGPMPPDADAKPATKKGRRAT